MRGATDVDFPSGELIIPTSLKCNISHFDSYLYSCAANVQSTGGWATHTHSELWSCWCSLISLILKDCSLCTILQDCWFPPDMKSHLLIMWSMMVVSSTYSKIEFSWCLVMQSWVYIVNRRGLSKQPWGGPSSTRVEEVWLPISTVWGLFCEEVCDSCGP